MIRVVKEAEVEFLFSGSPIFTIPGMDSLHGVPTYYIPLMD
jgi:hypothetical protein